MVPIPPPTLGAPKSKSNLPTGSKHSLLKNSASSCSRNPKSEAPKYAKSTYNANELKITASTLDPGQADKRVSMAYRIRKTYYNFHVEDDLKTHLQTMAKKINFNDYDERQRRILLKCRDVYNIYHDPNYESKDPMAARLSEKGDTFDEDKRTISFRARFK